MLRHLCGCQSAPDAGLLLGFSHSGRGPMSGAVAAPTARRGTLTLQPTDPNKLVDDSIDPSISPSKVPSERVYPFAEGSYQGSWACGRPEGRGTYSSTLGSSYLGVWRRGWADGPGVYYWVDGRADVSRFQGEAERLPLLAAVGEGVRWSSDRQTASLLRNGIETGEIISHARAEEIAERLGISPPMPLLRVPKPIKPARVSKRELESLQGLLSKRQRSALDARLSTRAANGDEEDQLPFETLWEVIAPI